MAWSGAKTAAGGDGGRRARWGGRQARLRLAVLARRGARRARRVTSVVASGSLVASGLVPAAGVVAAGAAAVTAASIVSTKTPARASVSGSALILSTSVNGGTASAEATAASALGLSVAIADPTTWDAMTTAQFAAYKVVIIGDPSTSTSCASSPPSDAVSTASTWGPAVTGNVAVLGTAPVLAGKTTLMDDAIGYAANGSGTGLYVSLNCEDSTAADTGVAMLQSVDGGGFTVTGQAANCPSDAGTVNTWEALALTQFNGLKDSDLGPWASPACSVEETLNSWPAGLAGVGYLAGASPADFTASDGATGQAYVVAGAPVGSGTAELAASVNGQVPERSTGGGGSNPAAPGVSQPAAGGVNTENGDYTQSSTDFSVPVFGPSLDFTRTYDAQAAQQQTLTKTPGPLGYGWTDDWSSSLAQNQPAPGGIYTIDGQQSNTGEGGPATSAAMNHPGFVYSIGGDTYIADTQGNRVEEIPGVSKTQFGIAMTAGDMYTIAGSPTGAKGESANGSPAFTGGTPTSASLLTWPEGVAVDSSGDVIISDSGNCRVVEVAAATHTQWGIPMTAGGLYVIAGRDAGSCAVGNDSKPATSSDLNSPAAIRLYGTDQDLYIADAANNRIQMVAGATDPSFGKWGISSTTAGYVYTVAGSAAGTSGGSGLGGPAASATLDNPDGVWVVSNGIYIADTFNCRAEMVARSSGAYFGIAMTANDIYTVSGRDNTQCAVGNDGKAGTSSDLSYPQGVTIANGGQLYIADTSNARVQEVAFTGHTEWGQSMTAGYVYTIAGTSGHSGHSGDGGPATSALMSDPGSVALDGSFNLYIADTMNNEIREVSASTYGISDYGGGVGAFAQDGDNGPAVNAGLLQPYGVTSDAHGDLFIADSYGNRVQEVAAYTHTQFGISMTAGDDYTVAGQQGGYQGVAGDGGPATSAMLSQPTSVAVDSAGNLYIADSMNNRIQEVSASTGGISTVAGSATGTAGNSGQGGPATSARLNAPCAVAVDAAGDLFIAGNATNQVQEVPAATGSGMTAGDIYTIAGLAAGTAGFSGDTGPATSAELNAPQGVAVDSAGDVYISDYANNRIREVAAATHRQWGQNMTAGDIYTVAGGGTSPALDGDGGPASQASLSFPGQLAIDAAGDLFITDAGHNRIREIAAADGAQWAQSMTAGYIYNIAGNQNDTSGFSGDGGPAASALLNAPAGVAVDPAGDLFLTDSLDSHLREVTATSTTAFAVSPQPDAITITQPGGAQATFYPQTSGNCPGPYVTAGQYCALPQDAGATLAYDSAAATFTFTPQPGTSYTYNTGGNLTAVADAAGNTLTLSYGTVAPGSGNCPATANWCQTITAANGRALTVGYNAGNLVTSVTDPLGRQWDYTYTGSQLTSVTDPMGNVTSYTYGEGSTGNPLNASNILTITKPNGQAGGPDAGAHTSIVYDAAGQVTSETDPMGYTTAFTWDVNPSTGTGADTITDPDGNQTVYYYSQGTLAAQSAWTGSTLTSEQDYVPDQTATSGDSSAGTQLDVASTDGNGNITTTSYDTAGNPVSVTSPDGIGNQAATTTQQSTSLDQPDCSSAATASSTCSQSAGPAPVAPGGVIAPPASIPPLGITWTQYDTDGNQLWTTTGVYPPNGATASYAQTTYSLYKGNSLTFGTNTITCNTAPPSPSLPCATVNADGVVTQLAYDAQGDLTSSSTPDGNGTQLATTTNSYNGDGQQTATTSPDGNLSGANTGNYTTVTAYNNNGQQTAVTQAGGSGATVTPRTTSYGYDPNGNRTSVTDARGYTTNITYNSDDQATFVTNPDGNSRLYCYDGDGNTAQTVPLVGVAANTLTATSCPTSYPSGYSDLLAADATVDTFNALGQMTQETTPAPAGQTGYETTTYAYDSNGNLTKTTAPPTSNASGAPDQMTVDTYNSAGQVATETTGYGTSASSTVSYCYDPNGDQTSVVYPDGNTSGIAPCETSYPWVVSSNSYLTQAAYQATYAYDSAGELVSTTSPATAAAPSGATTTSTYDPAGNELTSTDPNGVTTTRTYTPLDKPATVTYSGSSAHSVTYIYDANGNKTAMSDATGTSGYNYDPFGELTSAANGAGQTIAYGYNADGKNTSITYPLPASATWAATKTVTYAFDHADLLTGVTDFNQNTIGIANNADGRPSSVTLGSSGDTVTTSYDPTGTPSAISVTNSTSTLQSFSYSYSPAATILSETDTPTSSQSPAVYAYDAKGRVTSMTPGAGSTLNYSFDASGNLTTLPTGASATYDKAGELTSSSLSGTTTGYTYSADGQRLATAQGSTTISSSTWNGAGQLTSYNSSAADMSAAEYDGDGLRTASTMTLSGQSPAAESYIWNSASGIPQIIMDSVNAYIYSTGIAPAEQIDLSNGAVTYLTHDRAGSVRGIVNSGGTLAASTYYDAWGNPASNSGLTDYTPFGYAGGYTDPTGLIYLLNRFYDPSTGQFLSIDPAVSQTEQSYSYASGDPVINNDPTGLWTNGFSCSANGFYVDWPKPMGCVAVAYNSWRNVEVPIRQGQLHYTVEHPLGVGYGRVKVVEKHGMWMQALINLITFSLDVRYVRNHTRIEFWNSYVVDGVTQLGAVAVDDLNAEFGGKRTPDHMELGILTAHCTRPDKQKLPLCPMSVNYGPEMIGAPGWTDGGP